MNLIEIVLLDNTKICINTQYIRHVHQNENNKDKATIYMFDGQFYNCKESYYHIIHLIRYGWAKPSLNSES